MALRPLASRRLTILLLAALLLMVASLWALTHSGLIRAQARPQMTNATLLLTTDRTGLKLCVQSLLPGVDSQTLQESVRGMVNKISNAHPDFRPAGLGHEPVDVAVGCPGQPAITNPGFAPGRDGVAARVTTPSPYRLFVFVAPPERLASTLAWKSPRRATREVMCEGSYCGTVTGELYVTLDELRDPQQLERSLTQGLGLWPVGEPRPTPRALPTASPRR